MPVLRNSLQNTANADILKYMGDMTGHCFVLQDDLAGYLVVICGVVQGRFPDYLTATAFVNSIQQHVVSKIRWYSC